ncbi:MAG TPA: hypothetical protein VMZ91_09490 [Candidatus Paceibacterota bacterium]|nr:hypothetical protein [Candidatus Paceibacterota bacterium]
MDKGFNLPIEMNIPIEIEQEINREVSEEISYESEKQKRIKKTYDNRDSQLRKIADYIWLNQEKIMSYTEIAEALGTTENCIKQLVATLNLYRGFSITMIPFPSKVGFIQTALQNGEHYEKWDIKKKRTISTMTSVRKKASIIVSSKETSKESKKENKEKAVQRHN